MSFVAQCKQELLDSEEALRQFKLRAEAGLAYWTSRIATLRSAVNLYSVSAPQLDVPEAAPGSVEEPAQTTQAASTDVEATGGENDETAEDDGNFPLGVETGRGGRPRLLSAMSFVLEQFGPMHPEDMNKRIVEQGLQSNSKKPVEYIRFCLSKNKDLFEKVPGERGKWRSKVRVTETSVKVTSVRVSKGPEEEEQPAEIRQVSAFRDSEKAGVKLDLEQATRLVEDMTDPRRVLEGTSTFTIPL